MDDEFAKDVSEFDTLKELKEDIKQKQQKQNDDKAKYETQDAIIKAVCENIKVEIPSGMIEMEIDNMFQNMELFIPITWSSNPGIKVLEMH